MSHLPPRPPSGWDPYASYRPFPAPDPEPGAHGPRFLTEPPPPELPPPAGPVPPPPPPPEVLEESDPGGSPRRPGARIVLRCTREYHDWALRLADYLGVTLTTALTMGLMHHSEASGFSRPPRRYRRKFDPDHDA